MDEGVAIRAFARMRFRAMAEELAAELRERPSSDIYGDDIVAKSIWDEYCYEAQNGPTFELIDAWSSLLDPLVADLIHRAPHEVAVLLTIAEQWYIDTDEASNSQDVPYSNPDLIAQAIFHSFRELAADSYSNELNEDEESYSEWSDDDPDEELYGKSGEHEEGAEAGCLVPESILSACPPNTGTNPDIVQAGIALAGYHIEMGARTFAAYANAMIDDLGDTIRPHLRGLYELVRYHPGMEVYAREMSSPEDIGAALAALETDHGNQGSLTFGDAGAAR